MTVLSVVFTSHQFSRIEHRFGRAARVLAVMIVRRIVIDPFQRFIVAMSGMPRASCPDILQD